MIGGDDHFCLKFWAKLTLLEQNADFQLVFARSTSAITPSAKVQLTLIGSPLHAFQ